MRKKGGGKTSGARDPRLQASSSSQPDARPIASSSNLNSNHQRRNNGRSGAASSSDHQRTQNAPKRSAAAQPQASSSNHRQEQPRQQHQQHGVGEGRQIQQGRSFGRGEKSSGFDRPRAPRAGRFDLIDGSFTDPVAQLSRWVAMEDTTELIRALADEDKKSKEHRSNFEWLRAYFDWDTKSREVLAAIVTNVVYLFGRESLYESTQQGFLNKVLEALVTGDFFKPPRRDIIYYLFLADLKFAQSFACLLTELMIRHQAHCLGPNIRLLLVQLQSDKRVPGWMALLDRYMLAYQYYQTHGMILPQDPKRFNTKQQKNDAKKPDIYRFSDDPPIHDHAIRLRALPTTDELQRLGNNDFPVRTNPIRNGEGYGSLEEYVDTHWRLLRADALEDLHHGLVELAKARDDYQQLLDEHLRQRRTTAAPIFKFPRSNAYFVYTDVSVDSFALRNMKGSSNSLNFILSFRIPNLKRPMDWSRSRRFMPGSLVVLSPDGFRSLVWGVVASRDDALLAAGKIAVTINSEDLINFKSGGVVYEMLETKAFWTSYSHVLTKLNSFNNNNFPFIDYIVGTLPQPNNHRFPGAYKFDPILLPGARSIDIEPYLTMAPRRLQLPAPLPPEQPVLPPQPPAQNIAQNDNGGGFFGMLSGLRGLFINPPPAQSAQNPPLLQPLPPPIAPVPVQMPAALPEHDERYPGHLTILDPSQWEALRMILTQNVSIIQGPPGTGKTFIGLKAAEILLHQGGFQGPILCVCYTNHALDQFLEGILKFEPNVVRVGGRSKSPALEQLNLANLLRNQPRSKSLGKHVAKRETARDAIAKLYREMHDPRLVLDAFFDLVGFRPKNHGLVESTSYLYKLLGAAPPPPPLDAKSEESESTTSDSDLDDEAVDELQSRKLVLEKPEEEEDYEEDEEVYDEGESSVEIKNWLKQHMSPEALLEFCRDADFVNPNTVRRFTEQTFLHQSEKFRRAIFRTAMELHKIKYTQSIGELAATFDQEARTIQDFDAGQRADLLRKARVVGMTTTGAAQNAAMLNQLAAKVVIIEEAAEIFEAHAVACLSKAVQKLILIGDHQQLRPKVTYFPLTKRGLDISLFERLIKAGLPHVTLSQQHRMHPDISRYIRPIYPHLLDGPNTSNRAAIKGILTRTFFVSHNWPESGGGNEEDVSSSKSNEKEAQYIYGLIQYLFGQGYKPEEINVIAMYQGQTMLLRNYFKKHAPKGAMTTPILRDKFSKLRVCSVDDFQGEENHIIIVSLVRSNREGNIGFVKTANRICVALSRAQAGMFVIGSSDTLLRSANAHMARNREDAKLWPDILQIMRNNHTIGLSLQVSCQKHPNPVRNMTEPMDWNQSLTSCTESCADQMDCGHRCRASCHALLPHPPCSQHCERVHPSCEHRCTRICAEQCGDCEASVEVGFPCGHVLLIKCQRLKNSQNYKENQENKHSGNSKNQKQQNTKDRISCTMPCERILRCGHRCPKMCGQPCATKCLEVLENVTIPSCGHTLAKVTCDIASSPALLAKQPHKCEFKMDCGHSCSGDCSKCKQRTTHETCAGKCGRRLPCSHPCTGDCSAPCPPCKLPCRISCIHGSCPKKCDTRCTPCMEKCNWSCSHKSCTTLCSDPCNREACDEPCPKTLTCGHPCIGLCGEKCPSICRTCHPDSMVYTISCFEEKLSDDDPNERYVVLPCNHVISKDAMDGWMKSKDEKDASIQLPECPQCKAPFAFAFGRYANYIKKKLALLDEIRTRYMHDHIRRIYKMNDMKQAKHLLLRLLDAKPMGRSMLPPPRPIPMLLILAHVEARLGSPDRVIEAFIQEILAADPENAEAKALSASLVSKILPQLAQALQGEIRHGAWYKCKNGHPYVIGECGGAMQEAKCPDCGETIGGANHALAAGNAHFGQADGSRHAAWSEGANMGNYEIP